MSTRPHSWFYDPWQPSLFFLRINDKTEKGQVTVDFSLRSLKVHKIENFFDSDFGICVISLLVMSKY